MGHTYLSSEVWKHDIHQEVAGLRMLYLFNFTVPRNIRRILSPTQGYPSGVIFALVQGFPKLVLQLSQALALPYDEGIKYPCNHVIYTPQGIFLTYDTP